MTAPQPNTTPAGGGTNGPAIAALICGLLALVTGFLPFVGIFLAGLLGIIAVVTGIIGLRRAGMPAVGGKGMAIGGIVTGILGLLLAAGQIAIGAWFLNDPEVQEEIERIQESVEEFATEPPT